MSCDFAIAICTYNRLKTLKTTLKSLEYLRGKFSFQIIVVNGPSTDGTSEYLKTLETIKLLKNPMANLSISRNIAIANCDADYISFIDDDAVPEYNWLEEIYSKFRERKELSAIGGYIRDHDGYNFQAKSIYCDCFGTGYACDSEEYAQEIGAKNKSSMHLSLTGTNVTFKTNDIKKINGFDEVYAYFLDETDVNRRLHDNGFLMYNCPSAEIHHKYAPSHLRSYEKKKNIPTNMYPIAKSISYYAFKHGMPEKGFAATIERVNSFYENEFTWKLENLHCNDINYAKFSSLMSQTYTGIKDGITAAFANNDTSKRITKHSKNIPPIIHHGSSIRDIEPIRMCMLSVDHSSENKGGIGVWTNLVASELAELGNEITVIGEDLPDSTPQNAMFTDEGFWSHNINAKRANNKYSIDEKNSSLNLPGSLATRSLAKLREVERLNSTRKFQIISSPIWDVEGAAIIENNKWVNILSLHTTAALMLQSKPEWRENDDYFVNHVLKVISAEKQALKRADFILANSNAITKDIEEIYQLTLDRNKLIIIPHGIKDIESVDSSNQVSINALENSNKVNFLFLGRLEKRKGIKELISIMSILIKKYPTIKLDIAGAGSDSNCVHLVEQFVSSHPQNVTWHGKVSEEQKHSLFLNSDIFIAPSLYESFGLIYVEAFRYGLPCIGFATGGVPEVVTNGETGFLSGLGDIDDLVEKTSSLIENKKLRLDMGKMARNSYLNNFTSASMGERINTFLHEIKDIKSHI